MFAVAIASKTLHALATALRRMAIIPAVLACASCPGQAPGEGEKALAGYRRAAPVIAAFEQYRRKHGAYPDSLGTLVPEYLQRSALAIPSLAALRYPFQYELVKNGYRLGFRYTGPGMNQCWYGSQEARWNCVGHY